MGRSGAVTFKGNPLTLAGNAVKAGQPAPDFKLHYFEGGLKELKLADLKGKPTLLSVVPSLDTPVCADPDQEVQRIARRARRQDQRRHGEPRPAVRHEPLLRRRGHQEHATGSDYQDRNFGNSYGTLIEELKILSRAIFVLDEDGKVVYAEYVPEVASEPDYEPALAALKSLL